MTIKEFTDAYNELCDAVNWFAGEMDGEPTLEARNVMFHRQRLLESLEAWWAAGKGGVEDGPSG